MNTHNPEVESLIPLSADTINKNLELQEQEIESLEMILNEHEFQKEKTKINFKIVPSELNSCCLLNSDTTFLSITNFPIINLVVNLS